MTQRTLYTGPTFYVGPCMVCEESNLVFMKAREFDARSSIAAVQNNKIYFIHNYVADDPRTNKFFYRQSNCLVTNIDPHSIADHLFCMESKLKTFRDELASEGIIPEFAYIAMPLIYERHPLSNVLE